MRSRHVHAPRKASSQVALAAAGLAQADPAKAASLMAIALDMPEADPTDLAAAAALGGAPELLRMALARGADPFEAEIRASGAIKTEAGSLLRLAFLGGSPECCSILAGLGADPLARSADGAGALSPEPNDAGAYPWACALAALESSGPDPAGAMELAKEIWKPAMRSFSGDMADPGAVEVALRALAKLSELGADLRRSPGSEPQKRGLADLLLHGALAQMFSRGGVADGAESAVDALANFHALMDPGASARRFKELALAHPPGASEAFMAKGVRTLRERARREAMECGSEQPPAWAALKMGERSTACPDSREKSKQIAFNAKADAVSLWWLAGAAPQWPAPTPGLLAECKGLIASCLVESAKMAAADSATKGGPAAWLERAKRPGRGSASSFAGRHPMECAKLAALSHPELMASYDFCAPRAAMAADPRLSEDEVKAVGEAAQLAAIACAEPAPPGAGPLRM